jgi:hypothetical protein
MLYETGGEDAPRYSTIEKGIPDCGAVWDIFRPEDSQKIREYLKRRDPEIDDPIHRQTYYLSEHDLSLLAKEGVGSFRIYQNTGDAVFVPAGCAHQVRNRKSCVKVAVDYLSPEHIDQCHILLMEAMAMAPKYTTNGFREKSKDDVLQLWSCLDFAWKKLYELIEGDVEASDDDMRTRRDRFLSRDGDSDDESEKRDDQNDDGGAPPSLPPPPPPPPPPPGPNDDDDDGDGNDQDRNSGAPPPPPPPPRRDPSHGPDGDNHMDDDQDRSGGAPSQLPQQYNGPDERGEGQKEHDWQKNHPDDSYSSDLLTPPPECMEQDEQDHIIEDHDEIPGLQDDDEDISDFQNHDDLPAARQSLPTPPASQSQIGHTPHNLDVPFWPARYVLPVPEPLPPFVQQDARPARTFTPITGNANLTGKGAIPSREKDPFPTIPGSSSRVVKPQIKLTRHACSPTLEKWRRRVEEDDSIAVKRDDIFDREPSIESIPGLSSGESADEDENSMDIDREEKKTEVSIVGSDDDPVITDARAVPEAELWGKKSCSSTRRIYTQDDMDRANKQAFQRGADNAVKAAKKMIEKALREDSKKATTKAVKGLEKAAKKVVKKEKKKVVRAAAARQR